MPDIHTHIHTAKSNYGVYDKIKNEHTDWAVTVLFYAAIHKCEAALFKRLKKHHSPNHEIRESVLKGLLTRIQFRSYSALKTASIVARYSGPERFVQKYLNGQRDNFSLNLKKRNGTNEDIKKSTFYDVDFFMIKIIILSSLAP